MQLKLCIKKKKKLPLNFLLLDVYDLTIQLYNLF